jgi:hypothetical protein
MPVGYNEGKALYVNDFGLYTLIVGSKKREAQTFKRWITHEVLPVLRRKGQYSLKRSRDGDGEEEPSAKLLRLMDAGHATLQSALVLQQQESRAQAAQTGTLVKLGTDLQAMHGLQNTALNQNNEQITVLQQTIESQDSAITGLRQEVAMLQDIFAAREASLTAHQDALVSRLSRQLALPVVCALQRLEARVCDGITQTVQEVVMSPVGNFVSALRAAVRCPAVKGSSSEHLFPSAQKRTDAERAIGPAWLLDLSRLAESELAVEQDRRHVPRQTLTYRAWLQLRSPLGRALKRDRIRRHALPVEHADHCSRPLLWDRVAGGPAYVLLATESPYVRTVLRGRLLGRLIAWNTAEHARGPEPWPMNRDDLQWGFAE